MAETVRSVDLGVEWDPNTADAVFLTDEFGSAALAMNARLDDLDQRAVVLLWSGARYRLMAGPNDEARSGHRLHGRGLESVLWAGEVVDSELVSTLERQNRVHPHHDPRRFDGLVHHVVLTKEETVEVVAESITVKRIAGETADAARDAFRF